MLAQRAIIKILLDDIVYSCFRNLALTGNLPVGRISQLTFRENDDEQPLLFFVYLRDRLSEAPGFLLSYETSKRKSVSDHKQIYKFMRDYYSVMLFKMFRNRIFRRFSTQEKRFVLAKSLCYHCKQF